MGYGTSSPQKEVFYPAINNLMITSIYELPQRWGMFWIGELTESGGWVDASTAELALLEWWGGYGKA